MADGVLVISSTWETAAILESASPRNPRDAMCSRSSTFSILLVAWRRKASGICSSSIPDPLSVMRISFLPPSVISTVTAVAPASIAFSTSSFTTEEGRSTTSPAAILSIVFWSKTAIFLKAASSFHGTLFYQRFLILFCRLYKMFMASIGVRFVISSSLISCTISLS